MTGTAVGPDPARAARDRRCDRIARVVIALHVAVVALLAWIGAWTTDELTYLHAGIALRAEFEFTPFETILHGPLALLPNQIAALLGVPIEPLADYKAWGRFGMLPYAWLAAWAVWRLAHELSGPRVALAAVLLHAMQPILLAHAPLMTPDLALAATWTLATWLAVRWLLAPSWRRALAAGVAIGLALATKYLALLLLPAIALGWLVAAARGLRPGLLLSRRAAAGRLAGCADALLAALVAGAVAWVVLWGCYRFAPSGYEAKVRELPRAERVPHDPDAGAVSDALRAAVRLPLVPAALRLLPAPFVRGIDFQQFDAEHGFAKLFDRRAPGIAGYYVIGLLAGLPIGFLLLLLAGLVPRAARWPPHAGMQLAILGLSLLALLSFGMRKQIGVRYVLPLLPLLALVAARPLVAWLGSWGPRRIAGIGLAVAIGVEVATALPAPLGWCNLIVAGREHRWFHDSTLAWPPQYPALSPTLWLDPWLPDPDRDELLRRHPGAVEVYAETGPRPGRVIAHVLLFGSEDPRDPARLHHWLGAHRPIDREGDWLAFDVAAADWPGEDPRARAERATALLAAGDAPAAAALAADNPDPQAALVRAMLVPGLAPAQAAVGWLALGQAERALASAAPQDLAARAAALELARRDAELVELIEPTAATLDAALTRRLAAALVRQHRFDAAAARLDAFAERAGPAAAAALADDRRLLATILQTRRLLEQRIGRLRLR